MIAAVPSLDRIGSRRLALAVLLVVATPALSQDAPRAGDQAQAGPAWSTECRADARSGPLSCRMEQRIVVAKTGQLVGMVSIRVPSETREPVAMIQAPLGLSLEGGIALDVDGSTVETLPLQTCDASGCYAGAAIKSEVLSALSRGTTLTLVVQNLDKQPVKLPLSLAGFAAAFAKVK
nr:invasion associated locus B family protein [Prosthecomicrobium pneumaticum]